MTVNTKGKMPLIVIVGPTASGKTGLSIKLAKKFNGEIISADSRAIYKGMDVGSAKPSVADRDGVPHWGFDLVRPDEEFTAADFKRYAERKIIEIQSRGHTPIIVGGTGLYVDAVIFDYQFPPRAERQEREKWDTLSLQELHEHCIKNNVELPENRQNKRYVINTILRNGNALKRLEQPRDDAIIVGITTNNDVLRKRIEARTEDFLRGGVLHEARQLAGRYGWESQAMTGNIYPLVRRYDAGEIDYQEMVQQFNTKEWRLAKRQLTWLKRNEHITWLPLDGAYTYLAHALDSMNNL